MANIDIELECAVAQEHVSEVERSICIIKEWFRSVYHHLQYQSMPWAMIKIGVLSDIHGDLAAFQ